MDAAHKFWHYPAMTEAKIPDWQLYGEVSAFPDILHVERIVDRAAGLDWTIGAHRHLHLHQLFLLTSGTITLTLDGAATEILPPAIINIPRGTVHSFTFSAGTEGYVLTVPAHDFPDVFTPPSETASTLAQRFTLPADPALCQRFQTIAAVHGGNPTFRRSLLRAETSALMAQVSEKAHVTHADPVSIDPRIQRFAAMVRDRISQRFSLQDVARALNMSPRHLSRLCRSETGMSAQRYFEAQKMREACRLLVYTRMSAQQIAYQLGFEDPSYFSRVFLRNFQFSPNAYRSRFDH